MTFGTHNRDHRWRCRVQADRPRHAVECAWILSPAETGKRELPWVLERGAEGCLPDSGGLRATIGGAESVSQRGKPRLHWSAIRRHPRWVKRLVHSTCLISTSACSNQNRMSISRYIVVAVVRCSCVSCRLPCAGELAEAEVAVGDEEAHDDFTSTSDNASSNAFAPRWSAVSKPSVNQEWIPSNKRRAS